MSAGTIPAPGGYAPILPPGLLQFKYVFTAQLADGSVYCQTFDEQGRDISPFTEGRNSWYELLEREPNGDPKIHPADGVTYARSDIMLFQLEDGLHCYLVDLRDGHFEIQHGKGKPVGAHFWLGFPPAGAKLRPYFKLRRRHHTQVTGVVQQDGSVRITDQRSSGQECEYHFGWETLDRSVSGGMVLV